MAGCVKSSKGNKYLSIAGNKTDFNGVYEMTKDKNQYCKTCQRYVDCVFKNPGTFYCPEKISTVYHGRQKKKVG